MRTKHVPEINMNVLDLRDPDIERMYREALKAVEDNLVKVDERWMAWSTLDFMTTPDGWV